jgi:hypothetical protein
VFEQAGKVGHFAIFETWRDQAALASGRKDMYGRRARA